jgi:hypothetical protein
MKINGSILLDDKGSFANVEPDEIKIKDFADMLLEADACKDKIYYDTNSSEWSNFYAKGYYPGDSYWKECGQIAYQLLFMNSNPVFHPKEGIDEYNNNPEPKTYGGFNYVNNSNQDYVYNKSSIEKWHEKWLKQNPDKIDWNEFGHDIWPRCDRTITILREQLKKNNIEMPSSDEEVVNTFYDKIMKHLNERDRIAYAMEIGSKVCECNYYERQNELEQLEQNGGNNQAKCIYSIKKDGKFIFLSIDKQHGMFELIDDNGTHIREIRFDGSHNKGQASDHSLKCVAEWKKKYKK